MTGTTITNLPKNKTRIFAGDTLQQAKSTRNEPNIVAVISPRHRSNSSINLLLTSIEQNRLSKHGLQPCYSMDGHSSTTNKSGLTTNGIQNGFRPSTIRRQKSRITSAMAYRDNSYQDLKDISSRETFVPSVASARLKSEIDLLNSKLKVYGDLNKILRLQNTRDMTATPPSALSYATSDRLSPVSTNPTPSRLHQRFSSAITNEALNTLTTTPGMTDTSNKSLVLPSSPCYQEDSKLFELNPYTTHAYQIPQRSNVGSESIFPLNPPPPLLTNKTRSTKTNRHSTENKSVLCPFYVMYFTNLAMQQRPNYNKRVPSSISRATTRKGTLNSRISTSHSRYQSSRRQVHSPISINSCSTMDDDNDSVINATSYYNNKRFSAKMAAFENENSHMLKDILRTTSWNHVQM